MSEVPYMCMWVNTWQEAQDILPDQPVVLVLVLVLVLNPTNTVYMRYLGEFYPVDYGSYSYRGRWRIDGVGFDPSSVLWMIDNSISLPFSAEDLVLYQLTWGLCCE